MTQSMIPSSPDPSRRFASRGPRRRTLFQALGLAGAAAAATACTQRPADNVSGGDSDVSLGVCWWGSEDRDKTTLDALDIISEKKGWSFTTDYGDWGSYWDKLTTQLSGGTAPDVVSMNATPEIVDFAKRGALLSLDDYVDKGLDLSALTEDEQKPGSVDGELFGVTLATSCPALIYNKTKLDELGMGVPEAWTWQEYADFCAQIHEAGGGDLYGSQDSTASQALDWMAIQRGYAGIYDGNKLALTEDDFVDWFVYWNDMRKAGGTVTAEINSADDGSHPNNPVVKGSAVFGMGFNISRDVWAGLTKDDLEFASIPSDTDVTGNYLSAGSLFSINADTEHPDECAEFITTFISDPEVSTALGFSRGMPNATALESLAGDLEPAQQAMVDYSTAVADGRLSDPPAAPTGSADVGALIEKYADEVAFGRLSPEDGATRLYAEAQQVKLGS